MHSPAHLLETRLIFPLLVAHSFLVVSFSVADSHNFIINLVVFHAIFNGRMPGVTWLCDKQLLLGAKIDWYVYGPLQGKQENMPPKGAENRHGKENPTKHNPDL